MGVRVTGTHPRLTVIANVATKAGATSAAQSVTSGPRIKVDASATATTVRAPAAGPQGPPGVVDLVWPIKPDATLSYDAAGLLTRVDYADGTYKDLAYVAGVLTTISGMNLAGDTITKTLGYSGGQLVTVTTVVT